ncbi:MAG: FAD-binding oxidoreductase [Xanthomonadaceae bacterium]|nr:FAD-binding oxidoreductase [Xanthomonadaceae bacterium]
MTARTAASAYPPSWHAASVEPLPPQPALEGETQTDICILGAGYTGLSAALELAEAGYRVVVLEAERVGWGASGRNGGQILFGYGCGESKIENLLGRDDARKLFDWSCEGVDLIRERRERYGIDCDWRDGHCTVAIKPRHIDELSAWRDELAAKYDYPLEWWDRDTLRSQLDSPRYLGGLFDPRSGHLHPLKYALGLARAALNAGVRIHERSHVLRMTRGDAPVLHTANGRVRCKTVILAGNALVHGVAPELDRKIMPVGTYIGATAPLPPTLAQSLIRNGMAVADTNWALDYFRLSADGRLLFGGRASYSNLTPPNLRSIMRHRMRKVFPQLGDLDFEYLWGGVIDISLNRAPHWGRLDPNVYFAQGFSGHGVAATNLAGRVLAEAIRGQHERLDVYERIRHRDFPGGRSLRTPLLVAAMSWYKLRDAWW